jgi:hypothetical protein
MEIKYTNIKKKSLADAINFLTGLRYYKFINDQNEVVYSFIENEQFKRALEGLLALRKEINE